MICTLDRLLDAPRRADSATAWDGTTCVSWQMFLQRVAHLRSRLGKSSGKRWLLANADPLGFVVALYAVWQARGVAIVPPSLRPGAIESIAHKADVVIDDTTFPFEDGGAGDTDPDPTRQADPVGLSSQLELYTSGSSGEPKCIAKTLAQFDAEVKVLESLWGGTEGPVVSTVPHLHIYGMLYRLFWPLAAGRPFDLATCESAEQVVGRFDALGAGMLVSSPAHLSRMHESIDLGVLRGRARLITSSGGPLSAEVALRFHQSMGMAPLEVLGSTETGGIAWRQRSSIDDDAWLALPTVQVNQATEGAAMSVTSPFIHAGEPGGDSPTHVTGDAIEFLRDGRFRLLRRVDRVVKVEEKRLSLPEMEARLTDHPWVSEAAVIALGGRRQRVAAAVVLNREGRTRLAQDGRHSFARSLRSHLAHWFDAVLLPEQWRYPERLPYNERGKLTTDDISQLFVGTDE